MRPFSRYRQRMLLLPLLACTNAPAGPVPDTSTVPAADTAPADTDTDTAPVDTAPVDTAPPTDTASDIDPQHADGIVLLSLDTKTHADFGYEIATYEVTADYAWPMQTAAGSSPRFHVLAPPSAEDPRPVVVFLHGGSMDVDTKIPTGENGRCTDEHGQGFAEDYVLNHQTGLLAARLGWVVIVPENGFCDGWVGEGLADPYDPHHGGSALIRAAVRYLQVGQDQVAIGEDLVIAGHSAGGRGATWYAARNKDVTALVFDSGTTDVLRYYYEDDYSESNTLQYLQDCLEHNLGGPPHDDEAATVESAYWPAYRDLGLVQALEAERLTVPVFHLNNAQDGTSPPVQHEDIPGLLAKREATSGLPGFTYDVNHRTPGHPQLPKSWAAGYTALQFSQGARVAIIEAESGAGSLGGIITDNPLLNSAARASESTDGAGTLVTVSLPVDVGGTVGVLPVLYNLTD
ncbi:MAG: pimeloyl-ACP methyl ester carboxylesterase, partial [Myxococcota bacterium]